MLQVHALQKSLPDPSGGQRVLFAGVELAVKAGEWVAIVGESGSGKSTLLNCIAGLEPADSGEVHVAGERVDGLDDEAAAAFRRRRLGFVFQAFHVLPHLRVAQNVALPLWLLGLDAAQSTARVAQLLAAVGLGAQGECFPAQLSGGELQRVAIARALVHRPALVLADEPTGNLDADNADRVLELLHDAVRAGGAAGLLVTHSERAAAYADRVLRLGPEGLQCLR